MALRLIEVLGSKGVIARVPELLREHEVVDVWVLDMGDERGVARVLVRSEHTEAISDILSHELEGDAFRLLLQKVEATLPAPEEEEGAAESEEGQPERISREELYERVAGGVRLSKTYLATVALSALVAAVGLIRGDVAIIIGAMVIAPLLAPNVALSLASTLGDVPLAVRSLKVNGAGVGVAFAVSLVIGLAVSVDPDVSELATRTSVGYSDIAVAIAAGCAGTLAYTAGLPAAIVGVMVAVALLPPLVASGLLAGSGRWSLSLGAFILVITNVTCINLAGVATFLAQRVRPRSWWEAERAQRATRLAIGSWLGMLAVLAAAIYFFNAHLLD